MACCSCVECASVSRDCCLAGRSSSHKYEGDFKNGCFDGFGVFTRSDGMKYEGEFKDGNITGCGKHCDSSLRILPHSFTTSASVALVLLPFYVDIVSSLSRNFAISC